jgi:hypothetical protein
MFIDTINKLVFQLLIQLRWSFWNDILKNQMVKLKINGYAYWYH